MWICIVTALLDNSPCNRSVYVNLQTNEATGLTSCSGIRDVTGGSGNDILVGNVLSGGEKCDFLIACNGRFAAACDCAA